MNEIFYIKNTVDEWHSAIKGYFPTLESAKEALKDCCDWYRPMGTGRIYKVGFGISAEPELVYENL